MVSGTQYVPDELLPPSEHKEEVLTFLALAHGDREDAKRGLILLADEDPDLDVEGEDVAVVTQSPPTDTFS